MEGIKDYRHKGKAGEDFYTTPLKKRFGIFLKIYFCKLKRRNATNSVDYRNPEPGLPL